MKKILIGSTLIVAFGAALIAKSAPAHANEEAPLTPVGIEAGQSLEPVAPEADLQAVANDDAQAVDPVTNQAANQSANPANQTLDTAAVEADLGKKVIQGEIKKEEADILLNLLVKETEKIKVDLQQATPESVQGFLKRNHVPAETADYLSKLLFQSQKK